MMRGPGQRPEHRKRAAGLAAAWTDDGQLTGDTRLRAPFQALLPAAGTGLRLDSKAQADG